MAGTMAFMPPHEAHQAQELVDGIRRELEAEGTRNRFVELVAAGKAPREQLAALASEELLIVPSDQRSFAILAARFPEPPSGGFFLGLAQGEATALSHLGAFAAALGLDPRDVAAYEPRAGCQAYPAYVAWLAVNGSRSQVATALLANLDAFGSYCARIAAGLREHYGLDDAAVAFFDFFASTPPGFRELALSVIQSGLDAGEGAEAARPAARLLQSYELLFWETLAGGLS
jgi:thiaminase